MGVVIALSVAGLVMLVSVARVLRRRALSRNRSGASGGELLTQARPRELPIYVEPESGARRSPIVPLRRPGAPARILVAEDDDAFRELVMNALARDGHQVDGVGDGWQLCKVVESSYPRSLPDLIITDVRMPMLSGLEALGILRSSGVGIPVILMTAFGDAVTPEGARRLGASGVFDKPLDLRELRLFVQRVLEASPPASA